MGRDLSSSQGGNDLCPMEANTQRTNSSERLDADAQAKSDEVAPRRRTHK